MIVVELRVVTPPAAVALVVALLAGGGCRGDEPPAAEPGSTGEGSGTDASADASTTGPPTACVPGEVQPCYQGPPGTQGLGICRAGEQTCAPDGSGWTSCVGEVWPEEAERCDTPQDDDCDGTPTCEPRLEWWDSFPGVAEAMATGADGHLVVAGYGFGDFQGTALDGNFVLELDETGTLEWIHPIDTFGSVSYAGLFVGPDGEITIAGRHDAPVDFGGGEEPPVDFTSGYVARFDGDGQHEWSCSRDIMAYSGLAVGADGTAYVVGRDEDFELDGFYHEVLVIEAYEAGCSLAWRREGWGVFGLYDGGLAIAATEGGEVVVGAVMGEEGLLPPALDDDPLDVRGYELLLLGLDSSGALTTQHRPFPDMAQNVSDLVLLRRHDGTVQLAANVYGGGAPGQSVVLSRLDSSLALVDETLIGEEAWSMEVASAPDGSTVLGIEFSEQIELGPIGASLPNFNPGVAIAAVDDAGDGRWLELLYGQDSVGVRSLAVGPQGEVWVAANVDGGALFGGDVVSGWFLALLRP